MLVDSSESANSDDDQGTEFNFSYEKCFSDLKKKKSEQIEKNSEPAISSKGATITAEIAKYLSMKLIANGESPIKWWSVNKEELPNLALLSRKYLCAPPSSVETRK